MSRLRRIAGACAGLSRLRHIAGACAGLCALFVAPQHLRAAAAVAPATVAAATSAPAQAVLNVAIELIGDNNFQIDGNKPCVEGPTASHMQYRVTNNGATTLTGLTARISDFTNGFALLSDADYYIGNLAPGASVHVYWFIQPPCVHNVSATPRVTVSNATDQAFASPLIQTRAFTGANATGAISSSLIGPGAIVGQTIFVDALYTFGNYAAGTTFSFQPAGNASFDAGCFRMVGSEVMAGGTLNATNVPRGTTNLLYFVASQAQSGNGHTITMRYYFKYLCANRTTLAKPFASGLSGGQLKYSGNFDTFVGATLPVPASVEGTFNPSMSVSPALLSTGGTVTYTFDIANLTTFQGSIDSIAVQLPAGVTFSALHAGSGVTLANSSVTPVPGAGGTIRFRASPEYVLPGSGSLLLVFTAAVHSVAGSYTASATGYVGKVNIGSANTTLHVGADVRTTLAGPADGELNAAVQYVLSIENSGPAPATGVIGRITLPAGVTFVSGTNGATLSGSDVVFSSVDIGSSATRQDTITVTLGTVGSKLLVGSSTATSVDSAASSNDGSRANAQVTTVVSNSVPQMSIIRWTDQSTRQPGDEVLHSIETDNVGAGPASSVTVRDVVAAEFEFKLGSADAALTAGLSAAVAYSSDGSVWTYTPVSGGCGAPAGFDGCVRGVRWVIAEPVAASTGGPAAGIFTYRVRVR